MTSENSYYILKCPIKLLLEKAAKQYIYIYIYMYIHVHVLALQIRASQWLITANFWPFTTHIYHVMIIVTGGFFKKSFCIIFRSSSMQMFFKIGVVRNVTISRGKHLCWGLFNKIAGLTVCNFISASSQKRLQHKCFPENIAKSL